ncbi:MAG: hypothetical protein KGN79_07320, partial [Acidobacteriota bacterium]|nr:hypothetical protein [Acidobacteriota bacterium]
RVLRRLAEELDLPKLNFQVIRRTIATLGKSKGHVKDIQGMMRHSKASTTTDVYMQSLEPEVRLTINSIYEELTSDGMTGSSPQGPSHASKKFRGSEDRGVRGRSGAMVSGRADAPKQKPVRGVVLEFATRMRQSR